VVTADFVPDDTVNYATLTGVEAGTFIIETGIITGNVDYAIVSKAVPGVTLNAPGTPAVSGTTDAAGDYLLTNFGAGAYTVTASKPAQGCLTSNGVLANDAALIAQHVVGLIALSPTQIQAAKVSGPTTSTLTSFDAALIAQKVVGICDPPNQAGQWKFSPSSVAHPSGVIGSSLVENYTAIMMGDVNGDWNPSGANRGLNLASTPSDHAVRVSTADVTAVQGAEVLVPLRIENLNGKPVTSYQFDIEYDPAVITPARIAADLAGTLSEGLAVVSNVPVPGTLRVAVYGVLPVTGDGVYLNLKFTVLAGIGSSSPVTITAFGINDGVDEIAATSGTLTVSGDSEAAKLIRTSLTDLIAGQRR
jgi:hypothetical protein